jgi:hypothetical protein
MGRSEKSGRAEADVIANRNRAQSQIVNGGGDRARTATFCVTARPGRVIGVSGEAG